MVTGAESKVVLIDIAQLAVAKEFTGHTDYVVAVAFSYDSTKIATVGWDQTARIWDTQGQLLQTFTLPKNYPKAVAFDATGTHVFVSDNEGLLYSYNLENGEIKQLQGHDQMITHLVSLRKSEGLISTTQDGKVGFWDLKTNKLLSVFPAHQEPIMAVAVDATETTMLTGSGDHLMKIWDMATQQEKLPVLGHFQEITALAVSPDSRQFITASLDRTIRGWDLNSGAEIFQLPATMEVGAVAFSNDSSKIAVAEFSSILLYHAVTQQYLGRLEAHSNKIRWLAFTQDSQFLYSGGWDGNLCKWKVATGELVFNVQTSESFESALFLEPQNRILTGHWSGKLCIWNSQTGALIQTIEAHTLTIFTMTLSTDDEFLFTGSEDGLVKVWKISTFEKTNEFAVAGIKKFIHLIKSKSLVIATDRKLEIWSWPNGKKVQTIPMDSQPCALALTRKTQQILIGNVNGTLLLYFIK